MLGSTFVTTPSMVLSAAFDPAFRKRVSGKSSSELSFTFWGKPAGQAALSPVSELHHGFPTDCLFLYFGRLRPNHIDVDKVGDLRHPMSGPHEIASFCFGDNSNLPIGTGCADSHFSDHGASRMGRCGHWRPDLA